MGKAEVGSTKYIANKMKSKGLQRLRWYCQICEKQCRDENGFKQHTQSEAHVRGMLLVGEDPRKFINDYSNQFKRDFLHLLKTAHGEKKVHMNNFYQEYIREKEHVHMNSTKWGSLTEFAKELGKSGTVRVEEGERGLEIQWNDDSPEAVRRKEDVRRRERLLKGDEDMESRMLEQQIKKARDAAEKAGKLESSVPVPSGSEESAEPVKVSLSLGTKVAKPAATPQELAADAPVAIESFSATEAATVTPSEDAVAAVLPQETVSQASATPKMSLSLAAKGKPVNALAKKNPFAKKRETVFAEAPKKMSNAERIMKEELERKRLGGDRGQGGGGKRPRLG